MNYDTWCELVIDVLDPEQNASWIHNFSDEERSELLWRAGETIVQDNGGYSYYNNPDDAISEEANNIIGLYAIPFNSETYNALAAWYDTQGVKLQDSVRNYFDDGKMMYFVTGCGYDIFDADLLGGNADGTTKKRFIEFLETID